MLKKNKLLLIIIIFFYSLNLSHANENFFQEAKKKYDEKNYEDSKFLFQRSIVFNPKNTKSYLYLAKIFNFQKNEKEEEKNIKTVILLEPSNEEAIYMLMKIELNKSNYSKVRELSQKFAKICKTICKKNKLILETLKNLEPKNES